MKRRKSKKKKEMAKEKVLKQKVMNLIETREVVRAVRAREKALVSIRASLKMASLKMPLDVEKVVHRTNDFLHSRKALPCNCSVCYRIMTKAWHSYCTVNVPYQR